MASSEQNGSTPRKIDLEAFARKPVAFITLPDQDNTPVECAVWGVLDLLVPDTLRVLTIEDQIADGKDMHFQEQCALGVEQVKLLMRDTPSRIVDRLSISQVYEIRRIGMGADAANPQKAGQNPAVTTDEAPSGPSSNSSDRPAGSSGARRGRSTN